MTKVKTALSIVAIGAALSVSGCDSLNPGNWFESGDSNTNVKGPDRTYPKLSSVPERPPPRDEAAQKQAEDQLKADRDAGRTVAAVPTAAGLAADRDAARYTDDDLRRTQGAPAAPPPPLAPPEPARSAPMAPSGTAAAPSPSAAAPPAVPREAVKAAPPPPPSELPPAPPPPPTQSAIAPPSSAPARPVPAASPPQQAALPAAAPPPAPSTAMASEPAQVVAMAPIRSPGDPPPSSRADSLPSSAAPLPSAQDLPSAVQSNLVWGPPPSDIALVRSGAAGPVPPSMVPSLPPRAGGPAASVVFASGSTKLGANDEALLRQVAQQYLRSGGTISVIGHASQAGQDRDVRRQIANFSVSMDRATVVAQALQRYGVPGEAIAISAQVDDIAMNDADGRRADVFLR